MKVYNFIILLTFALTLISCEKNDDREVRFEGTMEAKINGELVVFYSASGNASFDMSQDCFGPYNGITGGWGFYEPDGHQIVLNFFPSQGIGTYNPHAIYIKWDGPYNDGVNNVGYQQDHFCVENQTHYEEEGEVTITSTANNRYKGIFHFTASDGCGDDVVVISDGKFEIPQKLARSCN